MRRSRALALALPVVLLVAAGASPSPAGPPDAVTDNETVFAELGPNGSARRVILVDWIRVLGHGRVHVEDALPGRDAKPLSGTPRPRLVGDRLAWDVEVEGARDLFMTATPTRGLPVDLRIRYVVDGVETTPERAQGASGRLRLEGALHNSTDPFVPLLANLTLSLPIASYTRLEPGEAQMIGVGRTVRLSYLLTPRPDATFAFEIDTRKADLPSISGTVLPQVLARDELVGALAKIRGALSGLRSGAVGGLQSGAAGLAAGAALGSSAAGRLAGVLGGDAITGALRKAEDDLERHSPLARDLAATVGSHDAPGEARRLAAALGAPGRAAGDALAAHGPAAGEALASGAAELREQVPQIAQLEAQVERLVELARTAGAPLTDVLRGLAQIESGARSLQAALGRLDLGGLGTLDAELDRAAAELGTPEEAERARAFDTFTGKPEGAEGEVRFVLRVAAPVRASADEPSATPRPRSLWRRLIDLLPG